MTVAELIAELQKMPQDLQVATQGCDCDGDVAKVSLEKGYSHGKKSEPDYVYLQRS